VIFIIIHYGGSVAARFRRDVRGYFIANSILRFASRFTLDLLGIFLGHE